MKTKLNLWLRRLVIRLGIRIVDAIESQCYTWQTELRARLAPELADAPPRISDFSLAWRVTRVLFLLLGLVAFVSFFATLHAFYFLAFAFLTLAGWSAIFATVRKIQQFAAPASGRREAPASDPSPADAGEILADVAPKPARAQAQPTPPPGSKNPSTARQTFEEFARVRESERGGCCAQQRIGNPARPRKRRGISSAEFNRRVVGQMEEIFNQ